MTGFYQHGTISRYTSLKCRCEKCRAANADYMRRYRRRRKKTGVGRVANHGTEDAYGNALCRCGPCRRAHAEYGREKRAQTRVE